MVILVSMQLNKRMLEIVLAIGGEESTCLHLAVPLWLKQITSRICKESGLFSSTINHVLINEYLPDQGIMVSIGLSCTLHYELVLRFKYL